MLNKVHTILGPVITTKFETSDAYYNEELLLFNSKLKLYNFKKIKITVTTSFGIMGTDDMRSRTGWRDCFSASVSVNSGRTKNI